MCQTVQREFRGWTITIRISRRNLPGDNAAPDAYTAAAEAELQPGEDPADWIDPRMQVVTTGNRSFPTGAECSEALFDDVKDLIDALRK